MNAATPSTTPNTNNTATMPSTHGSFDFFFGPAAAKGLIGCACAAPGNCGDGVDVGGNGADGAIGPEPDCAGDGVGGDVGCGGGGSLGSVPESGADVSGGGGSTGVRS